jgi:hypothetical protein
MTAAEPDYLNDHGHAWEGYGGLLPREILAALRQAAGGRAPAAPEPGLPGPAQPDAVMMPVGMSFPTRPAGMSAAQKRQERAAIRLVMLAGARRAGIIRPRPA